MCLVLRLQTHLQVAASSLLHRHLIEGRCCGFLTFAGMDAVLIRQLLAIVRSLISEQHAIGIVLPNPGSAAGDDSAEQQRRQHTPDHCSTSSARL